MWIFSPSTSTSAPAGVGLSVRERLEDRLRLVPVLLAEHAHVRDDAPAGNLLRLLVLDVDRHRAAARGAVGVQVVIGPVSDTDRLDPAEPFGEDFRVPAVGRVVRPLVGQVLPEPEPVRLYADLDEEFVGECDVVGDVFVRDDSLVNRLPHRHRDSGLACSVAACR